jgi:hypothetical protein
MEAVMLLLTGWAEVTIMIEAHTKEESTASL